MDEVLDFFKKDKPLKRKVIPGGTTSGRIALDESISNQWKNQQPSTSHKNDVVPNTSQYAEQHRLENQQELMNVSINSINLFGLFSYWLIVCLFSKNFISITS